MLSTNTEAATNLGFVDMECGPDELSFLQSQHEEHLKSEQTPLDSVVLQVNGVPVFVNPESMLDTNTEAATNLGFVDMECGPDELSFLQQQHLQHLQSQTTPLDSVVLQVHGVPVFVNPESMLDTNTQAATNLGFVDMECGPDELTFMQKDMKNIDDDEMAAALTGFNKQIAQINAKYATKK